MKLIAAFLLATQAGLVYSFSFTTHARLGYNALTSSRFSSQLLNSESKSAEKSTESIEEAPAALEVGKLMEELNKLTEEFVSVQCKLIATESCIVLFCMLLQHKRNMFAEYCCCHYVHTSM